MRQKQNHVGDTLDHARHQLGRYISTWSVDQDSRLNAFSVMSVSQNEWEKR